MHYSVWTALQKMAYRNEISDIDWLKSVLIGCWTQLSLDTLTEPSDQSAAKILMMVIKMEGAHAEFRLDQFCVHMITAATFITCFSWKLGKIHAILSN